MNLVNLWMVAEVCSLGCAAIDDAQEAGFDQGLEALLDQGTDIGVDRVHL